MPGIFKYVDREKLDILTAIANNESAPASARKEAQAVLQAVSKDIAASIKDDHERAIKTLKHQAEQAEKVLLERKAFHERCRHARPDPLTQAPISMITGSQLPDGSWLLICQQCQATFSDHPVAESEGWYPVPSTGIDTKRLGFVTANFKLKQRQKITIGSKQESAA